MYEPKPDRFVLKLITTAVVITVTFITLILINVNHTDHVHCLRLGEQTGLPTRYARSGPTGECYINFDGQWVPEERWLHTN
jgi:hypothetical protein